MADKDDLKTALKQSALYLLSRREYSCHELRQRLQRKAVKVLQGEVDEEHKSAINDRIDTVLDQLQQQDYQSDRRFAESLVRSRISRGQGEIRIAQELRHKGVADELRQQVLEACEQDWFELAFVVLQRRFGGRLPGDRREQAKQQRFLLYRGFTSDQSRYAFEQVAACSEQA